MASMLHSKKLSVGYKLQFWRSCVLSIMTHGLHCCGITGDGAQEAQWAQMRHVRAIVINQAHLTGDTHAHIMTRYNIPHFVDLLRHALDREAQAAASQQDWMWDDEWDTHVRQQLDVRTERQDQDEEDAIWSCPKCDASFVSFKIHPLEEHMGSLKNIQLSSTRQCTQRAEYQLAVDVTKSFRDGKHLHNTLISTAALI